MDAYPAVPLLDGTMVENRCTALTRRGSQCRNPIFPTQIWTYGHGDLPRWPEDALPQLETRACHLHHVVT
jgi:hypothetical protein